MLTKSLLTIFITSILVISCSKNHDISGETTIPNADSVPTEKPTSVSFKLTTSSDTITAFSKLQILNRTNYTGNIDSITTYLTGADTSVLLHLSKKGGGIYHLISWDNYFYIPGVFTIKTIAYNENKVVAEDSSFKITILKDSSSDFLGIQWSDQDNVYYIGKPNTYYKYYFSYKKSNNVINVITRTNSINNTIENIDQYNFLYNLMLANYGESTYSDSIDQTELAKQYSTLFSKHNDTPKAIWILKNSKVVLATYEEGYHLYAEKL
ncbi:hypothetical protein [Rhizosphaericola mali]|uniref:Lipoprotein n=1 Tax=Rhizosphaericola mali TaxID=2545455 RepID=A0A5P2G157_9BACT|nr:hypothetical protein [Rhizosphaericola mali]QES87560.1 hypothetical protein E0W69_002385 [Rhizosphaericola mali]